VTDSDKKLTALFRKHGNGMTAFVLTGRDTGFSWVAGAVPTGENVGVVRVSATFESAKMWADAESKCPQPCRCPDSQ
jgi:hypothetical protein